VTDEGDGAVPEIRREEYAMPDSGLDRVCDAFARREGERGFAELDPSGLTALRGDDRGQSDIVAAGEPTIGVNVVGVKALSTKLH